MALANYKAVLKVDYKPSLTFYDKLFTLASSLKGYADWITTGLAVTLQDLSAQCSVTIAHSAFIYIRDMKEEKVQGEDEQRIRAIVDSVPPTLEIQKSERVGLRLWYLCPVRMTFDNLVSVISEKFLVQNKEIREGICPRPTDVAYNVHFVDNNMRVVLRAGPMKKAEIEMQFQPDRNTNFPLNKRTLSSAELFADFPEVGLLIDIDVSKTDVKQADLWTTYIDARNIQSKLSENIVRYVLGRDEKVSRP